MLRSKLLVPLLVLAWNIHAQSGHRQHILYPEQVREDTEALRALLHASHPDPYRYASRTEVDARIDRLIATLAVPVSVDGYLDSLMPIFHMVGTAHFHPEPGKERTDHLQHRAPLIPLRVRWLSNGLYVEEELKGFRSLPSAARIISINGRAIEAILDRMNSMVVADGANLTLRRHLVEKDFPALLNRLLGDTTAFRLRCEHEGGEHERIIFAMNGDEIMRSRKPAGSEMLPWRAEWRPGSGTVWATFTTLEPGTIERSGQSLSRFLPAVLQEADRNKAHSLVIDLRGASGGDPATAETIFAAFALEPFNAVRGLAVGAGQPSRPAQAGPAPPGSGPITKVDGDPRAMRSPLPDAFQGRVYLIADGGTRDAAALVVMLAKRTGRARIVGEETGSNALRFTGGGEMITSLPNSGIRVHMPLHLYLPEGAPSGPPDHGELPNYPLEEQAWAVGTGRDTVKETVLRMLSEMQ